MILKMETKNVPVESPAPMLNTALGFVNQILPQSFVDGPGNRAVIFLQGCNLHCRYCHNPFTIRNCNHCGICVDGCPLHALSIKNQQVVWDATLCVACDTCIQSCPNFSSPRVQKMAPAEVWEQMTNFRPFLSGISVSGGEPSLQIPFLVDFFRLVGENSTLTRLIETNGQVGASAYRPLLPYLDMALVDLKTIDPCLHLQLTGRPLEPTLESIHFLHDEGKLYAVQQVIVPGYTDCIDHAAATARFLADINPAIRLKFLRFRPHGTRGEAQNWASPNQDTLDLLIRTARAGGLENVTCSL